MPFLVLGSLLLPTAAVIYFHVPAEMFRINKEGDDGKGEVTLRALMRNPQAMPHPNPNPNPNPNPRPNPNPDPNPGPQPQPSPKPQPGPSPAQVMIIAVASMLANSDYAFLEPTLGDHATANKVRPRLRLRLGLRVRLGLALALALAVALTLTLASHL